MFWYSVGWQVPDSCSKHRVSTKSQSALRILLSCSFLCVLRKLWVFVVFKTFEGWKMLQMWSEKFEESDPRALRDLFGCSPWRKRGRCGFMACTALRPAFFTNGWGFRLRSFDEPRGPVFRSAQWSQWSSSSSPSSCRKAHFANVEQKRIH